MYQNYFREEIYAKRCNCLIWRYTYRASYCNVSMTNEMHNSYNQFYSIVFLSSLHVSKESSRSSAQHGIIYCITQFGAIVQASLTALKQLDSPARLYRLYCLIQYIMPCSWWWRLDSFETCIADKRLWNKNWL
jgi:hypothetical protein